MKRTLALVLALVMVIGMMAIPASADFSDSKDVKYTEAVEVVAAAGIIEGFEDGSFDPDGTLTREQAAKVVAYMLLGAKNADALKATSAPFADVAANRWSAGYIAYVANEGIINGRDAKTFDPTGKVTAFEFAKLMLGALGYDSSIEQYTGAAWSINVGKTALDIDLFDGNEGADYNAPATREEAALYIFNTLKADLVKYENKGSVIDLGNGITINQGASKAEVVTSKSASKTIKDEKPTGNAEYVVQFAEKYFEDLVLDVNYDAFDRPANVWSYDKEEVGTYAAEADVTYTTGVKGSTVYADLGKPDATKTEYKFYVDGKEYSAAAIKAGVFVTDTDDKDGSDNDVLRYKGFEIKSGVDNKLGGNGALVEIYEVDPSNTETYNEAYRVVVVNTYVAEISAWNEADEDKDEDESVDIADITAPNGNLDASFETTQFSESDEDDETVVLYTAAETTDGEYEVKSVVAADSVTATPTSYKAGDKVVAGGETYKYSALKANEVTKADVDAEDDVVIYLDTYGYAIYIDSEASESDDYAYVVDVQAKVGQFADGYVAKIVLGNGKGETTVVDLDEDFTDASEFNPKNYKKQIVTYSTNKDGEYTFDTVTVTDDKTVSNTGLSITRGKATMQLVAAVADPETPAITKTASSKTVFFVQDDDEYDVYVGIANVPSIKGVADTYVIVDATGTRANAVFISDAKASGSTSKDDMIVVAYDASVKSEYNSDDGEYYVYNVVNAGKVETMRFDATQAAALKSAANNADGIVVLMSVTYDKDSADLVTDIDVADTSDDVYTATGTVKAEDGLIGFGATAAGASYKTYDTNAEVYKVNSDCEFSASSVTSLRTDANDKVVYVVDDDDIVTNIYVLSVANA